MRKAVLFYQMCIRDSYERQRRKMHDYKNQLSTIQTLIKNGHTDEALSFTQKLTEGIAVEMSEMCIRDSN